MAENSLIEWTEHTFNPWMGCTMVAPECTHCYAKTLMDDRYGNVKWGPKGTRVVTAASTWAKVLKWDRDAAKAGVPARVFCCSLADVFEDDRDCTGGEDRGMHTLNDVRARLWALIESTPNLIWLLLTKRPQNILGMVPAAWLEPGRWPENVWTGTSAGCQATADAAVPKLLEVPGRHFLSCEPMLGPVDLAPLFGLKPGREWADCLCDEIDPSDKPCMVCVCKRAANPIDWVICGGESGPGARPMHPDWARGLRDQCVAAAVPFFFKQWGEWVTGEATAESGTAYMSCATGELFCTKGSPQRDNFGSHPDRHSGHLCALRVGKKVAGRLLDGRTWDELPVEFTAPIEVTV